MRFVEFNLVVLLSGGFMALCCTKTSTPTPEFSQAAYVWQQAWTPEVVESMVRSAMVFQELLPIAGTICVDETGMPSFKPVQIDLAAFGGTGLHVTPVFRMSADSVHGMGHDTAHVAALIRDAWQCLAAAARDWGVPMDSIQLDFDCPTESLPVYRQLLDELRGVMPATRFSITVLPTWLNSQDFLPLLEGLDHYVLQLHGLEKPVNVDSPVKLCDTEAGYEYTRRASALSKPFKIALPTYTYQVVFDPSGDFLTLTAESSSIGIGAEGQVRELAADAPEIAQFVARLRETPPENCDGIVWFRLPVATDRFNWTWPVLESVMQGVRPRVSLTAEFRTVRDDLRELWITNEGDYRPTKSVLIRVTWDKAELLAHDAVSGFTAKRHEGHTLMLSGNAPKAGVSSMAAWFVFGSPQGEQPFELDAQVLGNEP